MFQSSKTGKIIILACTGGFKADAVTYNSIQLIRCGEEREDASSPTTDFPYSLDDKGRRGKPRFIGMLSSFP